MKNLTVYSEENVSPQDFISFWSKQYRYANENFYNDNIAGPFTAECVLKLFEWKNGGTLSQKKKASVLKNYSHKDKCPLGKDKELVT